MTMNMIQFNLSKTLKLLIFFLFNEGIIEKGYASGYEFELDTTLCPEILETLDLAKGCGVGLCVRLRANFSYLS
ncbi:MAG: hypothetical protein Q8P57_01870 [Candidatus Pacearchaeota archaeon]|nr:hypothetical protein [Candidatus Pacearchaeota archaeon]